MSKALLFSFLIIFCPWIFGVLSISFAEDLLPFATPVLEKNLPESALIETTQGPFEVRFYRSQAPISVRNFEYLARSGFYDDVFFKDFQPGFVIRAGAPRGKLKGGPGWSLPPEINSRLLHSKGSMGWARVPSGRNPERLSHGSQFYITLAPQPGLDGFYTIFAQVIAGMTNVERLREGDKILRIRFPKKDVFREELRNRVNELSDDSASKGSAEDSGEKSPGDNSGGFDMREAF